jgi:hypothetical protein
MDFEKIFWKKLMKKRSILLFCIGFQFFISKTSAQQTAKLWITSQDSILLMKENIEFNSRFEYKNSIDLHAKHIQFLKKIKNKGYLFASIDTINKDYTLYLGEKISHFSLLIDEKYQNFGLPNQIKISNPILIEVESKKIINKIVNKGYFDAKAEIDSCKLQNSDFQCKLTIDIGKKYYFDSLFIEGENEYLHRIFAKNLLKHYQRKPFSLNTLEQIKSDIDNIPYFELAQPLDLDFNDTLVNLLVSIKPRKNNQINAFLGILPNAYNSNQLEITGDVTLALNNLFNRGVRFQFNWQKPVSGNQFLNLESEVPFLFKTPIGALFNFGLEKFDSSFLRIQYNLGASYQVDSRTKFSFYYNYQGSISLRTDSSFKITNQLPSVLDYSYNQFGFSFQYRNTDAFFFPRKGWIVASNFSLGIKEWIPSNYLVNSLDANGISYKRLYDSIGLTNSIIYLQSRVEKYFKLSNQYTYKVSWLTKGIFGNNIASNELFTFGGNRMPRGFDDHFFRSSFYTTLSQEFQYFLTSSIQLMTFFDVTAFKKNLIRANSYELPFGFGLGLAYRGKSSILNFSMGYGKYSENPIEFNNAKVHFGYVAVF